MNGIHASIFLFTTHVTTSFGISGIFIELCYSPMQVAEVGCRRPPELLPRGEALYRF
jgi:hypothetical protein